MQSFAVVLAAIVAAAQGAEIALPAGLPAGLPLAGLPAGYAHAGFPLAGLPAGYAHAGLPLAGLQAGLPLNAGLNYAPGVYAHAGLPLTAQPLVQTVVPAAPKTYAVPPARIIENPAHVETISEKVEQHGYKIKY